MIKRSQWAFAAFFAFAVTGCNEATGPGNGGIPTTSQIAVLNSLSKTLLQFNRIDGRLVPFGDDIQLGANFDGVNADFVQDLWVTTTSSFGGSQIIFGAFSTGEQLVTTFPGADPTLADAGKPTVVIDAAGSVGALVPARGRDQIYIAFPGAAEAQLLLPNVGSFVERAMPAGDFIVTIDANLDDEGDFSPLGPPTMTLHNFFTGQFFDQLVLTGSVGATEALVVTDRMAFLAGGGVDPVTLLPTGDGNLVRINIESREMEEIIPLEGNGLSFEPGRNGLGYVVRAVGDYDHTDVLTYNFFTTEFERGPANPLQPKDSDGSDLTCRVVTAFVDSEMLCATFEPSAQGRLVLLAADGTFIDDAPIGAGATDIILR